jgi:hypothetical protein
MCTGIRLDMLSAGNCREEHGFVLARSLVRHRVSYSILLSLEWIQFGHDVLVLVWHIGRRSNNAAMHGQAEHQREGEASQRVVQSLAQGCDGHETTIVQSAVLSGVFCNM